jgi:Protein of unknown function (DUF2877)
VSALRFTVHSAASALNSLIAGGHPRTGIVLGSSPTSAYLAFDGLVMALNARTVPLMPNGATVVENGGLEAFEAGAVIRTSTGGLRAGRVEVTWKETVPVDLVVPLNETYHWCDVALRGRALLDAMDHDGGPVAAIARARPGIITGEGLEAVRLLITALSDGRPEHAREAARLLTGRGPGLTPDGDDLLAAVAAATHAFEGPAAIDPHAARRLRAALLVDDLGNRTGALSATLLRLAVEGHVIDPVRSLLDLTVGPVIWLRALGRLERIGHSTGGTYALGCALAALALAGSNRIVR